MKSFHRSSKAHFLMNAMLARFNPRWGKRRAKFSQSLFAVILTLSFWAGIVSAQVVSETKPIAPKYQSCEVLLNSDSFIELSKLKGLELSRALNSSQPGSTANELVGLDCSEEQLVEYMASQGFVFGAAHRYESQSKYGTKEYNKLLIFFVPQSSFWARLVSGKYSLRISVYMLSDQVVAVGALGAK